MEAQNLTAVILTLNEAENVRRCLASIAGLCPAFVVDSGSTDATVATCLAAGATVVHHEYVNHSRQWQWALENLPLDGDWILALDADYEISEALRRRVVRDLASVPATVGGIYARHIYRFGGNTIRFGGIKGYRLCLMRRGGAAADQSDLVDIRFSTAGRTIVWPEVLVESNVHDADASTWTAKQDRFSLRLAVEEELRRHGLVNWGTKPAFRGDRDQRTMWLRDKWLHLPLFVRPVLYFVYRYLLRGGFLDGRGGFLYHALQGFWLRLLVDWKTAQIRELGIGAETLPRFRDAMLNSRSGSVAQVARGLAPPAEGRPTKP